MSAVESWFAPAAAVAEPLPRQRPRRRRRRAGRSRRRGSGAASASARRSCGWSSSRSSLVGVVAVNVAVLRANVSVNDLDAKIAQLQQKNATLASQYASATRRAAGRRAAARRGSRPRVGLNTSYLDMVHAQVSRARAKLVNQRLRLLFLLILLTFGALAARTAYLQTVRASSLAAAATSQTQTTVVDARRCAARSSTGSARRSRSASRPST